MELGMTCELEWRQLATHKVKSFGSDASIELEQDNQERKRCEDSRDSMYSPGSPQQPVLLKPRTGQHPQADAAENHRDRMCKACSIIPEYAYNGWKSMTAASWKLQHPGCLKEASDKLRLCVDAD